MNDVIRKTGSQQAARFHYGAHVDQVDAVGLAVEMLAGRKHVAFGFYRMHGGQSFFRSIQGISF